ncbi:hypothetical protein QBC40DRAFT_18808 [Triangularia verruculosa]|uniref:Uncharacterized protein n=1 Tax=Triangularia verruculosa TaxID=2587418 RepID=A0AAN6X852_9PEZI|nr:hypothetical protein QBC40DRAFT_18808 [Triangularia verruculosa]
MILNSDSVTVAPDMAQPSPPHHGQGYMPALEPLSPPSLDSPVSAASGDHFLTHLPHQHEDAAYDPPSPHAQATPTSIFVGNIPPAASFPETSRNSPAASLLVPDQSSTQLNATSFGQSTEADEEQQSSTSSLRNPHSGIWGAVRAWWQELASVLLSISCVLALVSILSSYDGRPLADWTLGVTLNTVIALLSTICRMAFIYPLAQALAQQRWNWYKRPRSFDDFRIFDDASRGPWGSLRLLVRMRGRPLSAVACLILVTSIATSTLTQSVVIYPSRPVALTGNETAVTKKINSFL